MMNRNGQSSALPIHPRSTLHILALGCLVAALSYLASKLAGTLVLRPEMIWPVWPGCAFLVAVLLLTHRRIWIFLLFAGLCGFAIYDAQEHLPIRSTVLLLGADAIEVLVAAMGVWYVLGPSPRLQNVKSLAKYSLFAVILAPVSVASAAALALENDSWWVSFFTEALAMLTLTPAILSWSDFVRRRVKKPRLHYVEAAAMFGGLAIVAYLAFVASTSEIRPGLIYSLVPFLLWAALRFGIAGTSSSMVLVAYLATVGVIHNRGPFSGHLAVADVLSLQLFLLVAASSFMLLAAVVEQDKAAEEALRESEERLRLAAQVGRMFAYSWDAATDRIERTGESAGILGIRDEEVPTGAAVTAMLHPEDKEVLARALAALSVENPTLRVTYRMIRPDGMAIWVERNSRAYFDREGHMTRMVGMVADVTERKRTEQDLAEVTGKLIQAQEQERSRIGRDLHDDIGQRLAMLTVELDQLEKIPAEIPSRVRSLHESALEITNDVQTLSHELHQSSKLKVLGVVKSLTSWCREFSTHQNLQIDFRADVATALPVDLGLCLLRVLQEALHNVVKHSGVTKVEVELAEKSGEVRMSIADSGKGFEPEQAVQGRGLGLTSMRERVRLLNGTITIDSKLARGTRISVRIPLAEERDARRVAG